jgi:hypothetical protein
VLGLEGRGLEFDDHIAVQERVVEEQVDPELVTAHVEPVLAPQEGEAAPELQEEVP